MRIITIGDNNYSKIFNLLKSQEEESNDVAPTVRAIINDVKNHGDVALVTYTNEFDKNDLTIDQLRLTEQEIDEAYDSIAQDIIEAMQSVAARIQAYQEKLKPEDLTYTDDTGTNLSLRYVALDAVGIYVSGSKADASTSLFMHAIPARVAGVSKIVMVCPASGLSKLVIAAAKIAGVTEIYRVGGAQAIAALAYGSGVIPKVDKITGAGDAYVIEAKRQVFGEVGIDMIAGASESVLIADENNKPEWIAADLLSQAEQDIMARAILITTSQNFAQKVVTSVYDMLQHLERKSVARHSIEDRGLVIIAQNMSEAIHISNMISPEHVQLAVENNEELLSHITNAGAISLGSYTPQALGNYMAGPSSVLPMASTSRFSSGLAVTDFLKKQSVVKCSKEALATLSGATAKLAKAHGLTAHAFSVLARVKK